jgi:DNA modification methylase
MMAEFPAYKTIKTADLIPYARNSRTHSDAQVAKLAASIKEFGFLNPVIVDGDNGIIAGHGRILAAQKLGLESVPTIEADHLTEAQRRAYVIADNRLALDAGWDDELLRIELGDLDAEGFDLSLTGFDLDEIANLTAEEIEGMTDEDAVPEVPEDPVTVLGDVWLLGRHRLMCGDSTSIDAVERLMDGRKADMVFTDPPYGVDYDGGHATDKRRDKLINDDNVNMYGDPILNAFAVTTDNAPLYLWFADRFASDVIDGLNGAGYVVRNWIIWNKNVAQFGAIGAQYKSKHEPCIYAFKKGKSVNWCGPTNETTIWDVNRDHKNSHHPTQKPVELCRRAAANHSVEKILDLFGGSGSTLVACETINKDAFVMELDPKYCDVIVKRWQDFTGKKAVHAETNEVFDG